MLKKIVGYAVPPLGIAVVLWAAFGHRGGEDRVRVTDREFKAGELLGMDVRSPRGEALGTVEDVVVDVATSRVLYAAVAHGKTIGFGGKLVAVPLRSLDVGPGHVGLDAGPGDLAAAEGFPPDAWPDEPGTGLTLRRWPQGRWYTAPPAEGRVLLRVSQMIGAPVLGKDNARLGEVREVVLDRSRDRAAYVAFGYAGQGREEMFALPPAALKYQAQNRAFQLPWDKADFEGKGGFSPKEWPSEPDGRFPAEDARAY